MVQFDKFRLSGFKSFVDSTELASEEDLKPMLLPAPPSTERMSLLSSLFGGRK